MFRVLHLDSWETARRLARHLISWGFRGQGDASWGLETTIYRGALQYGYKAERISNREIWMLRQFQRRAHHYINTPPLPEQQLEWLALIQHYGGPTRLLDFTYSFYVAAFFALEKATQDIAIWAIDLHALENAIRKKRKISRSKGGDTIDVTNQKLIELAETYIGADVTDKLILHVEPNRLNERLSIQQGLFLMPSDVTASFVTNLAATFNVASEAFQNVEGKSISIRDLDNYFLSDTMLEAKLLKIVLPRRSIARALVDLHHMNINSATLFPGLDGFARSMSYHLRPVPSPGSDDEFYDL